MSNSRPYRSTLREERARDTRVRIRESARHLFSTGGFTETTIAQIAEGAGVAPQTVYAVFGSKANIVAEMLEQVEESAELEARVGEMVAEPDPRRQLRMFLSMNRALFENSAPVVRAALAARGDTDVAALVERGDANRRFGTKQLTEMWSRKGALREGMDPADASERLWLLTGAEQYFLATDSLDWSGDQYEQWLGDLLERELLEPAEP